MSAAGYLSSTGDAASHQHQQPQLSLHTSYADVLSTTCALHCTPVSLQDVPAVLSQLRLVLSIAVRQLQLTTPDREREREDWLALLHTVFAGVKDESSDGRPYSLLFTEHGHTPPPTAVPQQSPPPVPSRSSSLTGKKGKKAALSSGSKQSVPALEYRGSCAFVDRFDSSSPSTLLIDLINHFHDEGGHQLLTLVISPQPSFSQTESSTSALLSSVQFTSAPPSACVLVSILQLLQLHAPHLLPAFTAAYLPGFTSQLLICLSAFSDAQLKAITKQQIDSIYASLSSLLAACPSVSSSLLPQLVLSRLRLSHSLLCSDQFEKRIISMSLLNECIEAAGRGDEAAVSTTQQLLAFIVSTGIVPYLLSPSTSHPELIKRSLPLLSFCHSHRLLQASHLALLASNLQSHHQHSLHIIYVLLLELAAVLLLSSLHQLYRVMTEGSSAPQQVTVGLLRFLHSFSMRVLARRAAAVEERRAKGVGERKEEAELAAAAAEALRMDDGQWIGLSTCWRIFTLSHTDAASSLPPLVASTAVSLLQSMLRSPLCEGQRDYYAALCVDNVQHRRDPANSLLILQAIIGSFPAMLGQRCTPQWHASQAEFVHWLESRWQLLDLVIAGMAVDGVRELKQGSGLHSMKALSLALLSASPSSASSSSSFSIPPPSPAVATASASSASSPPSSSPPRTSPLQTHFNFLVAFLSLSTLTLSLPQARRVWHDHFLHAHASASSQAHSLRFFYQLLSQRSKAKPAAGMSLCIDDSVCLFFLSDCLCRLPLESFTRLSFSCFELYFLHVNAQQTLLSSAVAGSMAVNSYSLHGVDELWSLVMTAREESVRDGAVRLLLRVYHARSSIASVGAEGFIRRCLQFMNSPLQPSSSFSAAQVHSPATPHTPSASPLPPQDDEEPPLTPVSPANGPSAHSVSSHTADNHDDYVNSSPSNASADWEDEAVRNERTARCLRLLHAFIAGPAPSASSSGSSSQSSAGGTGKGDEKDEQMQVILQLRPPGNMKHVLSLPCSSSVAALRQAAAPLFSHPPSYLELSGTATSLFNNKTIADSTPLLSIPSNRQVRSVTVTVTRRPLPEDIRPTSSVAADSAAALLASNVKHYEKLYQLMAPKHSVSLSQPAFQLLQLLPVNVSLFRAVLTQSLKWKQLMPAQSPLQLLHILSVVRDVIAKQQYESDIVSAKRDSWLSAFVESDGLLHLRDVMMKGLGAGGAGAAAGGGSPASSSGDAAGAVWLRGMRVRVLGALLQLLLDIAGSQQRARDVVCEKERHAAIGQRVLDIIAEASTAMTAADAAAAADPRFIADCCVPTLNAAFSYLQLLLSTPGRSEENALLWSQLYSSSFPQLFLHTLLHSPFPDIRRAMSANVRSLIVDFQSAQGSPLLTFTRVLLAALSELSSSSAVSPSPRNTGEYFSLLSSLFRSPHLRESSVLQQGRGEELVRTLMQLIASHSSLEKDRQHVDDSLRGLLAFTAVLFHFDPALKEQAGPELVRLLYSDVLFAVDEARGAFVAKAKHPETRTQAYQTLLALLLRSQNNMGELLSLTFDAHSQGRRRERKAWELENEGLKQPAMYVGLKNLGNTCHQTAAHSTAEQSRAVLAAGRH